MQVYECDIWKWGRKTQGFQWWHWISHLCKFTKMSFCDELACCHFVGLILCMLWSLCRHESSILLCLIGHGIFLACYSCEYVDPLLFSRDENVVVWVARNISNYWNHYFLPLLWAWFPWMCWSLVVAPMAWIVVVEPCTTWCHKIVHRTCIIVLFFVKTCYYVENSSKLKSLNFHQVRDSASIFMPCWFGSSKFFVGS